MKKMTKKAIVMVLGVTMMMSMAACGSSSSSAADTSAATEAGATEAGTTETAAAGDAETEAASSDVITVRVAGTADYEPYTYVDENDAVTGYDIEIIKAIDELAPEIQCEYSYTQWDTLLPGLDADKFDVVSNQLGKNADREAMYLYPSCPFLFCGSTIISSADAPITTLDDLAGKKVGAIVGSSFTTQMEEYLEENPDAFTLEYLDGTLPQMLDQIVNGRVDATFNDPAAAFNKAEIAGIADRLNISDTIYYGGFSYYLFAQTDKGQQLADIFDKYLPVLYYNGTMAEIAQKYLGTDSGVISMADNGWYAEATLEEYQAAHE